MGRRAQAGGVDREGRLCRGQVDGGAAPKQVDAVDVAAEVGVRRVDEPAPVERDAHGLEEVGGVIGAVVPCRPARGPRRGDVQEPHAVPLARTQQLTAIRQTDPGVEALDLLLTRTIHPVRVHVARAAEDQALEPQATLDQRGPSQVRAELVHVEVVGSDLDRNDRALRARARAPQVEGGRGLREGRAGEAGGEEGGDLHGFHAGVLPGERGVAFATSSRMPSRLGLRNHSLWSVWQWTPSRRGQAPLET